MPIPYSFYITAQDEAGRKSVMRFYVPADTPVNDVSWAAFDMAEIIGLMSHATLAEVGFTVQLQTLPILNWGDPATGDVQERGLFAFDTVDRKPLRISIPCFDESLIVAGGTQIDLTAAPVIPFVNAMGSGIDVTPHGGSGTVTLCDSRGADITNLSYAKEWWGRNRS